MDDGARRWLRWLARAGREIAGAPARWSAGQWAAVVTLAAATLLAYVDKWPIQAWVARDRLGVERVLATFADACGSGLAVTSLGLAALAAGRWARRPALVDAALALAVGAIWCWLLTKAGQIALAERRPNDGGAMRLLALGGHGVSGHAAAAALLFFPARDVLARGASARVRRGVGVGLVAWAAFVGWSRVWLGMHFAWNVMLGFAIGALAGSAATRTRAPARSDCA